MPLNDVGIIAMSLVHTGELTEPCSHSAWYRSWYHFAYTFAHIHPNATLAFTVLFGEKPFPGQMKLLNKSVFVHSL